MEMEWAPLSSMTQAVPPAYSEFIGRQAMAMLTREAGADAR
ncbi:hypothetical protein [Candidatus Manganitrophus noduliformans]|nr:hypothetical protein [Candidatus Manganitrophus noduliformans]